MSAIPGLAGPLHGLVELVQETLARVGDATPAHVVVADRDKVNQCLHAGLELPGVAGLVRRKVEHLTRDADPAEADLVRALVSPDPQVRQQARGAAATLLDDARRDARRGARTARRSAKPSREERDLLSARSAVSKADAELATLRAEKAELAQAKLELDSRLVDLSAELLSARAQLEAANARVSAARHLPVDELCARLADLLDPPADPLAAADVGQRAGGRVVTPGHANVPAHLEARELARLARAAGAAAGVEHVGEWLPRLLRAIASPPLEYRQARDLNLRVEVLGAYDEVTGSAVLVSAGGSSVLVDAGTRAGVPASGPKRIDELTSTRLDAVVATHAHNDHIGWIPKVMAEQPAAALYATSETLALAGVMLPDSVKVMGHQAGDRVDGGAAPYGTREVTDALARSRPLPFGRLTRVGALDVELFPAGHILGAAGVVVHAGERRVVVSGDVSGPGQLTVDGFRLPPAVRGCDLLLLESTYGAAEHMPRAKAASGFVASVREVVSRGGRVLVPAFALGRAQEILMLLARDLPEVPVLVDGLARSVTDAYHGAPGPDGAPLRLTGRNVRHVERTWDEVKTFSTGVIVATSGMLTGGPAVSWARTLLPDENDAVFAVGYQDPASPLRAALVAAGAGSEQVVTLRGPRDAGFVVPVRARVEQHQLGAHAAAPELTRFATEAQAGLVSLVHGEPSSQSALRARLEDRGLRVVTRRQSWAPTDV